MFGLREQLYTLSTAGLLAILIGTIAIAIAILYNKRIVIALPILYFKSIAIAILILFVIIGRSSVTYVAYNKLSKKPKNVGTIT